MLKLKLQYFGHLMDEKSRLTGKDHDARKEWGQEKGAAEDEMVGWHHRLNGHEFEQTPGDNEGQGSLVWCSPWVSKTWLSEWTRRHERTWCQEDLISSFCFLAIYFYYPQWNSEWWFSKVWPRSSSISTIESESVSCSVESNCLWPHGV